MKTICTMYRISILKKYLHQTKICSIFAKCKLKKMTYKRNIFPVPKQWRLLRVDAVMMYPLPYSVVSRDSLPETFDW